MNYDNIIYPLDKIYSQATGVTYPVCAVGHDTNPQSEFGTLVIHRNTEVCASYDFYAEMQCTGPMDDTKIYYFGHERLWFSLYLVVDPEDNTKLIMNCAYDGQHLSDVEVGDTSEDMGQGESAIYDSDYGNPVEGPAIDWVCVD